MAQGVSGRTLSKIRLHDWRKDRYVEVPSLEPEYTQGLTLAQHSYIRARACKDRKAYEKVTIAQLIESRDWFRAQVAQLKRNKQLTNKKLRSNFDSGDFPVDCFAVKPAKKSARAVATSHVRDDVDDDLSPPLVQAPTKLPAPVKRQAPPAPQPIPTPRAAPEQAPEDDEDLDALLANMGVSSNAITKR